MNESEVKMSTIPTVDLLNMQRKIHRQALVITEMKEVLHRKNLALSALGYVWCDGVCKDERFRGGGLIEIFLKNNRYDVQSLKITPEIVWIMSCEVERMRRKLYSLGLMKAPLWTRVGWKFWNWYCNFRFWLTRRPL